MGLLDALADVDFQRGVVRDLADSSNRGVFGGLLGAPVDMTTGVLNAAIMGTGLLGNAVGAWPASEMPMPIERPVGGSEWIGQKLQDVGLVTANRNPLAEGLSALALPAGAARLGRMLAQLELPAARLMPANWRGTTEAMQQRGGPMYPDGKARLQADLDAGQPSGRYRLGDVTEGQGQGLDALFGRDAAARDVFMTDDAYRHMVERRLVDQGFSPDDVVRFLEQAMARRARPDLNASKGGQNPSLLNPGMRDPETGRSYDARVPLRQSDDGYEVRSVIPEGLRGRNNKAPTR
jgi:hypothetical protein